MDRLTGRNVRTNPALGLYLRAVADREVARDADLSAEDHAGPDDRGPGDSGLRADDRVRVIEAELRDGVRSLTSAVDEIVALDNSVR